MIFIRDILIIFTLSMNMLVTGQTIIPGGYVSGNWNVANSPYIIQDDILIHPDSTLAITEGTSVLFSGPFMLEVQGQLLVTGNPSSPVIFDRENDTIDWHGIYFNTTDTSITDSSILEFGSISHCFQHPCLTIYYSGRLRMTGFTIQYGEAFRGAGISCTNSSPSFDGLLVQHNHALDGAGISLENSSPVMKNCIIAQNSADGAGGGIVVFDSGAPCFENCTISQNQSYGSGGGIYINDADPVFMSCYLSENEGAIGGGNLYSGGGVSVKLDANPYFENCNFSNNYSHREGGGIASFSTNEVINCLFVANSAGTFGGGVYLSSGNLIVSHLNNCTFSDNDSPQGTSLATHNHTALLRNCILWHSAPLNPGSLIHLDAPFSWNVLDAGYSDIQNGQAGIENSGNAQYTWGQGNINVDPEFITGSQEISWQSPCIEAGTPDTTGLMLPETDLAGNPRLVNERVDMGTFEYQQAVAVQSSKFKVQSGVRIFPNPASEQVYITGDLPRDAAYQLLNTTGEIIYSGNISAGQKTYEINISGLPAGLYIIKIKADDFSFLKKIVILD